MNKMIFTTATVAALTALAGCNQGQRQAQGPADAQPGPMAYEPQPFEPVQVQPMEPQPQPEPQLYNPGSADADPFAPAQGGGTYTVQKGDTLWSIAQMYYGNGQRWVDIAEANPDVNPQRLPVGKSLVMP